MPTTNPAAVAVAATQAATQAAKKLPTPAELIAKIKEQNAARQAKTQVAFIDLSVPIVERPPDAAFNFFGGGEATPFRQIVERLQQARDDKEVRGVLLTMSGGVAFNLAQVQELRGELEQLRKAGKRTFAYADTYGTNEYLLASAATDVCILEAGELFMPGIAIEPMFYKGLLEKVGVRADYVQIGEFKGAEEPYTRTEPSPELRDEMDRLVKGLFDELVNGISGSRSLSADRVRRAIDEAMLPGRRAKEDGFVDHLVDVDGLRELMKAELGDEIDLLADYGAPDKPKVDFANPFSFLTAMAKRPEETDKPKVAIVYADGVIVDGEGAGDLLNEGGVGSEPIRRAMRMALRDEKVKAVVIRINSPGGSALASEAMWQSIRRVADEKPVVISVGSMAASGGYYIASAGEYIYADPAGIVGSIGVVGGKFVLGGLYDKLGLDTATFTAGANADLFSSTKPWDDRQRRLVRNWMKNTYDLFTERVMHTRKGKIADIDRVARGRIFTARQAKDLGMVDELGGLDQAINDAARRAKLKEGEWDTKVLPPPQTLADVLAGGGSDVRSPAAAAEATLLLSAMPAELRGALVQTTHMSRLLERRPVVLMTPYVLRVK